MGAWKSLSCVVERNARVSGTRSHARERERERERETERETERDKGEREGEDTESVVSERAHKENLR